MRFPRLRATHRHGGAKKLPAFLHFVIDPPRGRPVRGGGFIVIGGMGVSTPIIISKKFGFHRKFLRGIEESFLGAHAHLASAPAFQKSFHIAIAHRRLIKTGGLGELPLGRLLHWGREWSFPIYRRGLARNGKMMISPEQNS